jgi:iron(III)-enterobactin esterase
MERLANNPEVVVNLNAMRLLQAANRGTEAWWQSLALRGTPMVELQGEMALVSFFWRDPAGNEALSTLEKVYIDVNSVTDHHLSSPESLARIPNSDIWFWQLQLPAHWRGSYSLIPTVNKELSVDGDHAEQVAKQRQWWRSVLEHAQADPLNRQSPITGTWGATMSALHLPAAPQQEAWRHADAQASYCSERLQELDWHSALLANQRKVWVYQTGTVQADSERALVLLLDGQHWAKRMPIYPALEVATEQGQLPPAVYVLIDVIDGEQRGRDLPCNAQFWQAVQNELLPLIHDLAPCSRQPERTVVAGQSYGGLAAMYAALHWPERFGCVLSQSGSFWWPYDALFHTPINQAASRKPGSQGQLTEQLLGFAPATRILKVFQEVGSREDVMIDVNETMRDALLQAGHQVNYRVFEGGHDWLCWRGGLLDGLAELLGPV